jgi:hypothetical protein
MLPGPNKFKHNKPPKTLSLSAGKLDKKKKVKLQDLHSAFNRYENMCQRYG